MADQLLLVGQAEPARRCARGDDQCARFDPLLVNAQPEGALGQIGLFDHAVEIFGAEMRGLLLHVLDELRAEHAFGKTGKVFDLGGDGELASGLVPDDNQRLQPGARGVDRRCIAGAARTNDDDVMQ